MKDFQVIRKEFSTESAHQTVLPQDVVQKSR